MAKNKKAKVYAFIDGQNLNLGTKKDIWNNSGKVIYQGWPLDYRKFYEYLSGLKRIVSCALDTVPTGFSIIHERSRYY
jgi:hypothetical protein